MSDDGQVEDPARRLRDLAEGWTRHHSYQPHYNHLAADAPGLHVGWREMIQEAETAQRLLDYARIPDGFPQGDGDIDARVARAVWELSKTKSQLAAIVSAHQQGDAGHGLVDGFCVECERSWPCPTYLWASGQRESSDCWDPADDEVDA